MKRYALSSLFLMILLALTACGNTSVLTAPNTSVSTIPVSTSLESVSDLVNALKAAGATVESGDTISQPFFTPEGQMLTVNGVDIQVFEYASNQEMENEASQVASDGGSVGTSMVDWIDPPHFYKSGRLIVLYLGADQGMLGLLEKVIGKQFAGR